LHTITSRLLLGGQLRNRSKEDYRLRSFRPQCKPAVAETKRGWARTKRCRNFRYGPYLKMSSADRSLRSSEAI